MNIQITKPMNHLPVTTYRWLHVNDFNIKEDMKIETRLYKRVFFEKANNLITLKYALDVENNLVIDHNIIIAEANSSVTIVIDYSTVDTVKALHNGATKIYAKEGANITLIKIQRMNDISCHFDSTVGYIKQGAKVHYVQVELGSKTCATNYINHLYEFGASKSIGNEEEYVIVQASFNPIIDKIPLKDLRSMIDEEIHRRLIHE